MLKKCILLFLLLCGFISTAQSLKVGLRTQKTKTLYWESGITTRFSLPNLKPSNLWFGFDYYTSRFGSAMNSNAIVQDQFFLHSSWVSHPSKQLHFYSRLGFGYFHADYREPIFEEIPNSDFMITPEFGLRWEPNIAPIEIGAGIGYNVNFKPEGEAPGTLLPLYIQFDLTYVFIPK